MQNIILQTITGSHLYGTNNKDSDVDRIGIFMPTNDQLFGLKTADIIDESTIIKDETGKNTKDSQDIVFYSLKKFMQLALQNNPNILEILFTKPPFIENMDFYGNWLLENKGTFLHQGLKQRFIGYAISQKHKMVIKPENFKVLQEAINYFDDLVKTDKKYENDLLIELPSYEKCIITKNSNISIGDLNFQKHTMLKKAYRMVKDRLSKATHRQTMYTKYGYDLKFAMHTLRLVYEGIELITRQTITFPLNSRDLLCNVRLGHFSLEKIHSLIDSAINEIDSKKLDGYLEKLPTKPKYKEINNLTKKMLIHFCYSGENIINIGKVVP